jgi:PhoH-like ATPase
MGKTFCLDTNVLIDDPSCFENFKCGDENKVLIPYSVIMELDRLKGRSDINHIVGLAIENISKDDSLQVIKIPNKTYQTSSSDNDIIEDVLYVKDKLPNFVFVSNDKLLRLRLKLEKVEVCEFKATKTHKAESQNYTGFIKDGEDIIPNSFSWEEGKMIFHGKDGDKVIDYENSVWGVHPRHYTQNAFMEMALDQNIKLITTQSEAGFGKSYISIAAGLQLVLQKPKKYDRLVIIKPVIEIGNSIGFLPGSEEDKLGPYTRAMKELIYKLHKSRPANALFIDGPNGKSDFNSDRIEFMNLGFCRGLNLENCVVILDEGQNLSRYEARSILSRMGDNVKCFITGSVTQIDNPHLNSSNNGLEWILRKFKGDPRYGHVVLTGKHSRGEICDMVIKHGL